MLPGNALDPPAIGQRGEAIARRGQKSVQVKERSGFGSAIIIDVAARPDVQRARIQREVAVETAGIDQLLVAVVEEV